MHPEQNKIIFGVNLVRNAHYRKTARTIESAIKDCKVRSPIPLVSSVCLLAGRDVVMASGSWIHVIHF